jgi:hypothetical protein
VENVSGRNVVVDDVGAFGVVKDVNSGDVVVVSAMVVAAGGGGLELET